jgi:hypothetical protein
MSTGIIPPHPSPAAAKAALQGRLDRLEVRVERIERRLDLVQAP